MNRMTMITQGKPEEKMTILDNSHSVTAMERGARARESDDTSG